MGVLSLVAGFLLGVVATYLVSAFLLKPGLQKASDTATGELSQTAPRICLIDY